MDYPVPSELDLLLLSNSTNNGESMLSHAAEAISAVADGRPVVFLPFALEDWDGYAERIKNALPELDVQSAHQLRCPDEAILEAGCVFVGGGNTFRLLATLQRLNLVDPLGARIRSGMCSYIGSSAGTNIAGPSIRTTNDMPILDLGSLAALHVVPFQLNPHFTDATVPGLNAESRQERIAQFHEHSSTPVLALYEGSWLRVSAGSATVEGSHSEIVAKVFQPNATHALSAGDSLARWWQETPLDDLRSRMSSLSNRHHRAAAAPRSI